VPTSLKAQDFHSQIISSINTFVSRRSEVSSTLQAVPNVATAVAKPALGIPGLDPPQGGRTLSERAFTALHQAILSGILEPGVHLPIEDLASQLGMSPMPVREALRQLDAAGLVEHVPHRGARVTGLSLADLREIYEARLALEPLAIRKAATRFEEEDAIQARACLARLAKAQRAKDVNAVWAAHTDFHFVFYRRADSQWLLRLIRPLWESSERYRRASPTARRLQDKRSGQDEILLEACEARDADRAATELYNHLVFTANRLSEEMAGVELFKPLDAPGRRPKR